MFNIFSGNPEDWFSTPAPGSWWDNFLQKVKVLIRPVLGFFAPGALLGAAYAGFTDQSILLGIAVGGFGGFVLLYLLFNFIESVRIALQNARIRGHVRTPPQ